VTAADPRIAHNDQKSADRECNEVVKGIDREAGQLVWRVPDPVVESGHKEPDHADGDIKRTNDWSRRAPRPTP
jgi:hypothetical protein